MSEFPLVQARGLRRTFSGGRRGLWGQAEPVHAVNDVDIVVGEGEVVGLIGESGSGKSTVARLLLGLDQAEGGEVFFDGQKMPAPANPSWRQLRQQMQLVFQDPHGALDPRARVIDQVAEPLDIFEVGDPDNRQNTAAELLERVGLGSGLQHRYPGALSGGQKQRVVIARALVLKPRFLVCDEPVSALDVSIGAQVTNLLTDLQKQFGLSYLIVSHDLLLVRSLVDRVLVMHSGRIVEEAATDQLFAHPQHPYTQLLIDSVPIADPRRRRVRAQAVTPKISGADLGGGCSFSDRCGRQIPICATRTPDVAREGLHAFACHNPILGGGSA